MAKLSLPFFQAGAPFTPKIYVRDYAELEEAEIEAQKTGRVSAAMKAHAEFLAKILSRSSPEPVSLELPVDELNRAFVQVWRAGQRWEDPADPLDQPSS